METKDLEVVIYALDLHDSVLVREGMQVIRVPGGWLYETNKATTFVPLNNEFYPVAEGESVWDRPSPELAKRT